jgi:hypothetical protein
MAVVEYMLHRINGGSRAEIPGWVGDRGHFMNTLDNTYIGWVDDVRDYYVPDSVVILTKQNLIDRQLAIHAVNPFTTQGETPMSDSVVMTDAELTTMVGTWYDAFVAKNGV